MDKEIEGGGTAPRIIKVEHTVASQLAGTLSRLFSDPNMRRGGRSGASDIVPIIMADEGTNSLVVRARPADYNVIANMAAQLDVESTSTAGGIEVIPVARTHDVKELATQISRVVNDGERQKAAQLTGYKPAQVSIGYDERTPALLVSGSPELFKTVHDTIARLEEMRPSVNGPSRATQIIRVNNMNAADVKRIIDQLAAPPKTQNRK
jgi:type II secretory pathway component GspD/PulD (secretin)